MKAVLCKALGPPESLVLEDVADPTPGPGEVVVDVHASALNFPDVLMLEGKYQIRPAFPFSPGGEIAGVVRDLGKDVQGWQPGTPGVTGSNADSIDHVIDSLPS